MVELTTVWSSMVVVWMQRLAVPVILVFAVIFLYYSGCAHRS